MIEIILSHGLGSSAKGRKVTALAKIAASYGLKTHLINDVDCENPDQRAERLIQLVKTRQNPVILAGSSMGSYTSLLAAPHCTDLRGLFLIAPALYLAGYQQQIFQQHASIPIEIIHGWHDETVPWQNALRYAQDTATTLHLIAGDHRLHNEQAEIDALFKQFLNKIT